MLLKVVATITRASAASKGSSVESLAPAKQTERTTLSNKESKDDNGFMVGSAESLAPVRQAMQLALSSQRSSNGDDNKAAARAVPANQLLLAGVAKSPAPIQQAKQLISSLQKSSSDDDGKTSVVPARQTKRLMLDSSDDENSIISRSAAKADTLPYVPDDDSTEAVSDRGDGWSAPNTANREYVFITYDPWFVHHAKGEILLGVKSERKDVGKAECDQIVRKIDDFLSEHTGRAFDMRS
eukprot:g1241.t1